MDYKILKDIDLERAIDLKVDSLESEVEKPYIEREMMLTLSLEFFLIFSKYIIANILKLRQKEANINRLRSIKSKSE
jgi:hypothetical protein